MWTLAEYEATSLFSLKQSTATSSGGKTLLLPTPYTIKMALLDAICRTEGAAEGRRQWESLCKAQVALRPVPRLVVSNTFTRILKLPHESSKKKDDATYVRSIGYREYVQWQGALGIAIRSDALPFERLRQWLLSVQMLGKRGSFVQLQAPPQQAEQLPADYILIDGTLPQDIPLQSVLQRLDDCAPSLTFDKANVYSNERIELGEDRLLHNVLLPYQRGRATRSYTEYIRSER
ncbi:MAG: hypothetical protein NZ571_15020 [Anaerolineae bacterium]|nr:hypothetical protein [Anaerolineae bacterium]